MWVLERRVDHGGYVKCLMVASEMREGGHHLRSLPRGTWAAPGLAEMGALACPPVWLDREEMHARPSTRLVLDVNSLDPS